MLLVVSFAWVTTAKDSSAAAQVLMGEPCTSKADIFSLGVVLYEIVTGKILQLLSRWSLFNGREVTGTSKLKSRGDLDCSATKLKPPNSTLCRPCR